jgi:tetratricopeptide (TPR) repeat protein
MICYNNDKPDARTRARAFLEFYERYEQMPLFLDSALMYLDKAGISNEDEADNDLIRAYFLQENYQKIIDLVGDNAPSNFKDAWTCYRIGESYFKLNKNIEALSFLKKCTETKPYALDFQHKLCTIYLSEKKWKEARVTALFIIQENPRYAAAFASLGYIAMQENNLSLATFYLKESLMLNPDQVQTLINMSVVLYQQQQFTLIKPLLYQALKLDPKNKQIQGMLLDLK